MTEKYDDASAVSHAELLGSFWSLYVDRFPAERTHGRPTKLKSRWTPADIGELVVSQYLALGGVGVFVRGPRGEKLAHTYLRLARHRVGIEGAFEGYGLEPPSSHDVGFLTENVDGDLKDRKNWPWMAEWLLKHRDEWIERLRKAVG